MNSAINISSCYCDFDLLPRPKRVKHAKFIDCVENTFVNSSKINTLAQRKIVTL